MLKFKEFYWETAIFGDAVYPKNAKQIQDFLIKEQEDHPEETILYVDLKVMHVHSVILIYKLMPKTEHIVRSIAEGWR